MRILVTDGMDKSAIAKLTELGHEVVEQFYESDALGKALRDFDVVVVRSKTKVRANHIDEAKGGKPLLGICLGMQLLFERSLEYGDHKGLGLIKGEIRPIAEAIPENLKIPHIGWNALSFGASKHPLFRYLNEGDHVYFVHSYYGTDCAESTIATAEYGAPLTAAVAKGNVMGCQFHPEKSGKAGLSILRAFVEGVTAC